MSHLRRIGWLSALLTLWISILVVGCNQDSKGGAPQVKGKPAPAKPVEEDDHSEWWCVGHGIPEDICGQCQEDYRNKKKAEGDWCEKHKRLQSQCFICDPTLYERVFEPMYVAHFPGKGKPPRPPEKEFKR